MNSLKTANPRNEKEEAKVGDEVEVLYQRMGDRWFAFSLIDDEVFVGSLSPEDLEAAQAEVQETHKTGRQTGVFRKTGNS